jgi:KaiC/GvpD/RAD55 family RecA-like ATPase
VVATESHRNGLLQGLQARGVDTAAADEQERFILMDAAEVLSTLMENAGPSRERFLSTIAPLIRCAEIKHKRVVFEKLTRS